MKITFVRHPSRFVIETVDLPEAPRKNDIIHLDSDTFEVHSIEWCMHYDLDDDLVLYDIRVFLVELEPTKE
jgi:hypothetical protein